ncbi:MAG: MBOAT family protein [Lachnospiraceae bacterium]|nr:MBOAT family protein [Lachnospiraceae bacterium]
MVFSGLPFLFFFLPAFLLLYTIVRGRAKNIVLLLFSLFFYAWGEPLYIILMLVTTLVDYTAGRLMGRLDDKASEADEGSLKRKRRLILFCAVLVDLGLLGFFKYADMAVRAVNLLTGFFSSERVPFDLPGIALPIGISFYTFQSMSYTIDRYRGKVPVQKNYADYLTYVSMFPQLIAGPIVRYADVQRELKERHAGKEAFFIGFRRFLVGLFRKVLIANQMGALWDEIRTAEQISIPAAWLGLAAFTLQIYYDFSAYSDMAIGLGRMMGFHFLENFRYPLVADSVTEFWRRWHISLATWFRDYVYIPLGGNRKGLPRQVWNMFIVFFLTGLWHGAFPNYILWGLYQWFFLMLEKFFLLDKMKQWPKWCRHVYVLLQALPGFGLFYFEDLSAYGAYILKLFGAGAGSSLFTTDILWYAGNYLPQLLIACACAYPLVPWLKTKIAASQERTQRTISIICAMGLLLFFTLSVASLVRDTYNPFLYFRF